jgi:hypothetical protein
MSSLADLPELVGFFSYSREDDADSRGALSGLRNRVQGELRGLLGRTAKTFRLWQDKEAISPGTLWESEIKNAVAQSVFFVPIITPTVVASPYCRFELEAFLTREAELGRGDLVFPILYIDVPALEDAARRQNDPVLSLIAKRQYVDWREFRYLDIDSTEVKRQVGRFCMHIRDALGRTWLSPAERKAQEEAAAQRQAEAERERQEAEATRRAEGERRRATELETKARVDAERRQREAQAQREKAEAEKAEQRALHQKQGPPPNAPDLPEADKNKEDPQVSAAATSKELFGQFSFSDYGRISLIACGSICSFLAVLQFFMIFVLGLAPTSLELPPAFFVLCLIPLLLGSASTYAGIALRRSSKAIKIVSTSTCIVGLLLDAGAMAFIVGLIRFSPKDFLDALGFMVAYKVRAIMAYQLLAQALSIFAHGPALLFSLFGTAKKERGFRVSSA